MKTMKLKTILFATIAATGLAAGGAMAGPMMADTLLGTYDSPNSGTKTELGYFETASGLDYDKTDLVKKDGTNGAKFDPETGLFYIDVTAPGPGYFLLKFGTGGSRTKIDTYVFRNEFDMTQLVWNGEQVNYLSGGDCSDKKNDNNCNIGRLSHISFVPSRDDGTGGPGGNPGEVPEPASLALLGAGLAGMALRRRRG